LRHNRGYRIDRNNDTMVQAKITLQALPDGLWDGHEQVVFQIKGRILHTRSRGPYKHLVAAIPDEINQLILKLAQQGKWGQIVIYEHSALIVPSALAELRVHLKLRYEHSENKPVVALVFAPDVEGGLTMGPEFLKSFQETGIECRIFEDYSTALEWVELRIRQFSDRIDWKDRYKIGDAAIDEQHQELFRRANHVVGATSSQGQILSVFRLLQYLRTHISHEDELMRRIQYPDIENHRRQHEELIAKLAGISLKIANENLVIADLEEFIGHLFLTHMETLDSQLAEYSKTAIAKRS
jgi:hemerythrin-like metal-binding protein